MKKREFIVTVANLVEIPYEEGLVDGLTNQNHLMYIASAEIQKRGFDPTKAIYEFILREKTETGATHTNLKTGETKKFMF